MENKASLENFIIIFASFSFILFYFLPGFSFQNLISFVESVVSYGNPVTNLKIILISIGIAVTYALVRIFLHLMSEPLPPNYWMYGSSSDDD